MHRKDYYDDLAYDELMDAISINTGASFAELESILDREFEKVRAESGNNFDVSIDLFDFVSMVEDYIAEKNSSFSIPSDSDVNNFLFGKRSGK